ncbi:hypothetical protein ACHHYP_07109 [Achlya hypogyna]|uniref:Uncharacterized protein n=1 Tax=Achlya hypogyna TaxID=1202772 RepID=A0A1V9ZMS2_ACHHY|nr:hypothetical protein ACHHYP_07109 [Achlya hypogyna]
MPCHPRRRLEPPALTPEILEIIASCVTDSDTFHALVSALPPAFQAPSLQSWREIETTAALHRVVAVEWPTISLTTRILDDVTLDLIKATFPLRPYVDWDCGIVGRSQMELIQQHFCAQLRSVYIHVNCSVLANDNGTYFRDLLLSCPQLAKLDLRYDNDEVNSTLVAPLLDVLAHPGLESFRLLLPTTDFPHEINASLARQLSIFLRNGRADTLVLENVAVDVDDEGTPDNGGGLGVDGERDHLDVDGESPSHLGRALANCTTLRHLRLHNVALMPTELWASIPETLRDLSVYDNSGEVEVTEGLLHALRRSEDLKELKLSVLLSCRARHLADSLRHLSKLTSLHLAGTRFEISDDEPQGFMREADVGAILEIAQVCPELTHLNLQDHECDDLATIASAILAAGATLRWLNLRQELPNLERLMGALCAASNQPFKVQFARQVQFDTFSRLGLNAHKDTANCVLLL